MTVFALVSGSLFRAPEQRTSKTGRPYVTATLRVKDGEASQWWRVTAFSESAQAKLTRLDDGDACSVQGAFKAELYQPEGGEPKISFSIVAGHVLALRQPPRECKAKTEGDVAEACDCDQDTVSQISKGFTDSVFKNQIRKTAAEHAEARGGAAAFDDSIPFGAA
jgi:single-stranded DNA-binding protein